MIGPTTQGAELWRSDGTEAGTFMLKAGVFLSTTPTALNGRIYFSAYDATNGFELWTSDGTEAGTMLVKDLNPGVNSANLALLTNVKGALHFVATDGTQGVGLWRLLTPAYYVVPRAYLPLIVQ